MKKLICLTKIMTIMCATSVLMGVGSVSGQNPFFEVWDTPYEVPPFDQITVEDYIPAFEAGIAQQNKEVEAIISNSKAPDFENTIVALDESGELLGKVSAVFFGLNSANTSPEMQEAATKILPLLSRHGDDIALNPDLFAKVKTVYDQRDEVQYSPAQMRLLEETYKSFVRGGANLSSEKQQKLRKLNEEISLLQLQFGQNVLAETNEFKLVIDDEADLSGLPQSVIDMAAETANANPETAGKWVFTLHKPSLIPFLQFADNRDLRKVMFDGYINVGNNGNDHDNKEIVRKLVKYRLEKARIMGYDNYAEFVLEERMAKKPENVYNLLMEIWEPALEKAMEEASEMQAMIDESDQPFKLEGWDWFYYAEKIRQKKYNLDESEVKPYFKLENVRDGIFTLANKLYGITFTEVAEAPAPHEDASLWACHDTDGTLLGVLYLDFHPRASKRGGAWCGRYRAQDYQDGERVPPVVTIVTNFTAPTKDTPALLTADEAETFFHEFGHALHGLFRDVPYDGIGGVPRDFVELPSQIMEHWVFEPELLSLYARHYQTDEVIPEELVNKLKASGKYGQGYKTVEYVAASLLDMDYHILEDLNEVEALNVLEFEEDAMDDIGLISQIPPRYRSTYFRHTMGGGYTAGYYSYIWAEVLDCDAYQAFVETGDIFDKKTADRFRESILSQGGTKDAMEMYVDFRGAEPKIDGLLEKRGLK